MNLDVVRRWVLALFVLLFPFYVLPNGLPQPSHWLIAVACVVSARLLIGMFRTPDRDVLIPLLLFVGYTIVVNAYYSIAYPSTPLHDLPLRRSLYYVFSYGVFAIFLLQLRRGGPRDLRLFVACLFLSAIGVTAASFRLPVAESGRTVVYFNNPNQLGYYALTSLLMGFVFALRFRVSVPLMALFALSCLYLTARSLSTAAIASVILLCALIVTLTMRTHRSLALALAMAVAGLGLAALTWPGGNLTESLRERSTAVERQVRLFSQQRRIYRLVQHPGYLVLGAGQGAMQRFDDTDEVHSTVGTILFSYGIPGVALFALFIRNLVRRDTVTSLLLIAPLFAYGMAHNGLRFSSFWLSLCVLYYTASTPGSADDLPPLTLLPARFTPAWMRQQ